MNVRTLRGILKTIGDGWHDEDPVLIDVGGREFEIEGVSAGTSPRVTIDARIQLDPPDRLPGLSTALSRRIEELKPLLAGKTPDTTEASDQTSFGGRPQECGTKPPTQGDE